MGGEGAQQEVGAQAPTVGEVAAEAREPVETYEVVVTDAAGSVASDEVVVDVLGAAEACCDLAELDPSRSTSIPAAATP